MAEHKLDRDYNGKTMLRTWWPKVDFNFASIYAWLMGHFNGTADRHKAEHIDYDSSATVKQKIDKEISDRQSGDNALQTKLNTEITNRQNADSTLDGKIAAEVTNRQNADSELRTSITNHKEAKPLDHPDGSVTTSKLANGSITRDKIADDFLKEIVDNYTNFEEARNKEINACTEYGEYVGNFISDIDDGSPSGIYDRVENVGLPADGENTFDCGILIVKSTLRCDDISADGGYVAEQTFIPHQYGALAHAIPKLLKRHGTIKEIFMVDDEEDWNELRLTWSDWYVDDFISTDEAVKSLTSAINELKNTAFSGSYNDLSDTPTNATTSTDGFMSAADKAKLDGILTGTASGDDAIALGGTGGTASGEKSAVIGGYNNNANGLRAFIGGGYQNQAGGNGAAVVGGNNNQANGMRAFVGGGEENHANGDRAAIIGGINNNALGYQFKLGQYSKDGTAGLLGSTSGDAFIIGNGNATARSNAARVTYAGDIYAAKSINGTGADYAELREWQDGNPNNQDRCGLMVTLVGAKIRIAQPGDNIKKVGVISGNPCIIGNNYADAWHGKYKRDVFGRYVKELVHHDAVVDEVGNIIHDATDAYDFVLADDFDPTQNDNYVSREERPEFDFMGTHGEIVTIDDGTCEADGYCVPGQDGIATKDNDEVGFYVMERVDENHIRVFIR